MNIRGLKSKFSSFQTKIEELLPSIICITETHLTESEKLEIEGYEVFRNDREENKGGGLLIAVKNEIKNICTVVEKRNDVGQTMWIVIDNTKIKIRIGVVYAPQESRTRKEKLKIMYEGIQEQILKAEERKQRLMIVGDLNCKIGDVINGNRTDITKGGRLLLKLIEKNNLSILNASELCTGLWTRVEGDIKSVIDYIITDAESAEALQQMNIDEGRTYAPTGMVDGKEIYSDHNVMTAKFNWIITVTKQKKDPYKTITNKGYAGIRRELEERKVSNIVDENIENYYETWKQLVSEIVQKHQTVVKKKNPRKKIKELIRLKKELRKRMKKSTTKGREMLIKEVKMVDEQIKDENNSQFKNKIEKVVEELRSSKGINGPNMWEVLKKVRRKKTEPPTAVRDKEGNILEDSEEIKNRYLEHFVEVLKSPVAESAEEVRQEEMINGAFENIMKIAQREPVILTTMAEIEVAISELKKKKCKDGWGWKNEFIIEGGIEMKKSLLKLVNRMEVDGVTPQMWNSVLIKSAHKKGSVLDLDNKRGLFITEIISKVYEKVIKNRNRQTIERSLSDNQTGGLRDRATIDNHVLLSETIRKNKKIGKKTYVIFGDAVKCFDKLWLKDTLVELYKAGCSPQDIAMIYQMNKDTEITVDTPSGRTEKRCVGEVVKQGTVLGPTLCCIETDQINQIGEDQGKPLGNQVIGILVFVDDVMSAGTAADVERCIRNLHEMEKQKKFTYGLKKTKYMVINSGREEKQKIVEAVKAGVVGECDEYEYLGFWVNQDGNCLLQIEKKSKKVKGQVLALKSLASYHNVGPAYINVRLQLYENCILQSLLYNLEGWNKQSKKEIKKLESCQHKILCSLLGIPKSTPQLGLLNELGIWSVEERLKYRKIMLYHNIVNSDDRRLCKRVIEEQTESEEVDTFYDTVRANANSLGININSVKDMLKSELKMLVKREIDKVMVKKIRKMKKTSKLRFIVPPTSFQRKGYFAKMSGSDAVEVVKTRLNMLPVYGNYKKNLSLRRLCMLCEQCDDTTEHLLTCSVLGVNNISPEHLKNDDNDQLWRQVNEQIKYNFDSRNSFC